MEDADMARTLGRIEGKLDMLIDADKARDLRLSAVEKKVWYSAGASAAVAFVAAKIGFIPH